MKRCWHCGEQPLIVDGASFFSIKGASNGAAPAEFPAGRGQPNFTFDQMAFAILIPAYQPGQELVVLVEALTTSCDAPVVIVDDGGGQAFAGIIDRVAAFPRVEILRHCMNLGKGAALKTGLNHLAWRHPGLTGVVTADADGQHRPADILQVAARLEAAPEALIVGARAFSGRVPWRSRFGNRTTRLFLRLICGVSLSDTQTGLRGIPQKMIPSLMLVSSRGYEFELDMLLLCRDQNRPIVEVPIETVYLADNASSHFNPLIDSLKIYFVLFRFSLASLSSTVLDFLVFALITVLGGGVLTSLVVARAVAVNLNYILVRNSVFHSAKGHAKTLPQYLLLVLLSGTVTYLMINWIVRSVPVGTIAAKAIAESILFFVNFAIQREIIFRNRDQT